MYVVLLFGALQDSKFWFADDAGRTTVLAVAYKKIALDIVIQRESSEQIIPAIKSYAQSLRKYLPLPFAGRTDMNTAREDWRIKPIDLVYFKTTPGRGGTWRVHDAPPFGCNVVKELNLSVEYFIF